MKTKEEKKGDDRVNDILWEIEAIGCLLSIARGKRMMSTERLYFIGKLIVELCRRLFNALPDSLFIGEKNPKEVKDGE